LERTVPIPFNSGEIVLTVIMESPNGNPSDSADLFDSLFTAALSIVSTGGKDTLDDLAKNFGEEGKTEEARTYRFQLSDGASFEICTAIKLDVKLEPTAALSYMGTRLMLQLARPIMLALIASDSYQLEESGFAQRVWKLNEQRLQQEAEEAAGAIAAFFGYSPGGNGSHSRERESTTLH